MADQERPESLEPEGIPQEEIRRLNKANEDVVAAQENPLPQQVELPVPSDPVMDELTDVTTAEVPPVPPPELGPPGSITPTVQVLEDMAAVARAEASTPDLDMQARREAAQRNRQEKLDSRKARVQALRMSPEAVAKKRAEHGQTMAELGQASAAAGRGVLDQPLEGPGGIPKGEAERLLFPDNATPAAVTEAYRNLIEADKERWEATLTVLNQYATAINDLRQQVSRLIGAVERNCI